MKALLLFDVSREPVTGAGGLVLLVAVVFILVVALIVGLVLLLKLLKRRKSKPVVKIKDLTRNE